ncbi:ribosomal protein S18 acetylase RimI-like enzyme [Bacillus fengqiuensis]|nr:ribosomal protein S18 acetylase RimI-like enzyme [Bacillus fengqiuensis]
MIINLAHKERIIAEEIVQLQKEAYQVEARLLDFYDIPPLHDTFEMIQDCPEHFIGYLDQTAIIGVLSYEKNNHELTICRLMVHPRSFRQGIGQKLLYHVEALHPEMNVLKVTTGSKNAPAKNLYVKTGFHVTGEIEAAPGVYLTQFEKILN